MPCEHVSKAGGCGIYEDRPDVCSEYKIRGKDCEEARRLIPLWIKGEMI